MLNSTDKVTKNGKNIKKEYFSLGKNGINFLVKRKIDENGKISCKEEESVYLTIEGNFEIDKPEKILSAYTEKTNRKKRINLNELQFELQWNKRSGFRKKNSFFNIDEIKEKCPNLLIEYLEKDFQIIYNWKKF